MMQIKFLSCILSKKREHILNFYQILNALFCDMQCELDGSSMKFLLIVLWYAFYFSNSL